MADSMERKWYESPWTWVTGGCCLGCLLLPLACFTIAGTGGFLAVSRSSIVQQSLDQAQASPLLIEELGEPIEHSWFGGNNNISLDNGTSETRITIRGPKGKAELHARGRKRNGVMRFERLEARLDDGRVVNVLTGEVGVDDRHYEEIPFAEPAEPVESLDAPPPTPEDSDGSRE